MAIRSLNIECQSKERLISRGTEVAMKPPQIPLFRSYLYHSQSRHLRLSLVFGFHFKLSPTLNTPIIPFWGNEYVEICRGWPGHNSNMDGVETETKKKVEMRVGEERATARKWNSTNSSGENVTCVESSRATSSLFPQTDESCEKGRSFLRGKLANLRTRGGDEIMNINAIHDEKEKKRWRESYIHVAS